MRRPSAERREPQGPQLRLPVAGGARFVPVLSTQGKPSPYIVASKPGWTTDSTG
jgi:hypothetical protein